MRVASDFFGLSPYFWNTSLSVHFTVFTGLFQRKILNFIFSCLKSFWKEESEALFLCTFLTLKTNMISIPDRPANSPGFAVCLTVLTSISRSHEFLFISHGFSKKFIFNLSMQWLWEKIKLTAVLHWSWMALCPVSWQWSPDSKNQWFPVINGNQKKKFWRMRKKQL